MSRVTTQPARASGEFAIGGDLPVVRLGYGAMQIPGPGVWGEPRDHDEVIRVLRRALELGVTFIDTADSYGPEVSERLIHEALYPYPNDVVIATKAGMTRPGPGRWGINGKPEHLKTQAEKSLRLLGLERIELFQLHRIDPEVPLADQLGALVELQTEGKSGRIGLSEVTVAEIQAAGAITPIATVQNRYNLADRGAEPANNSTRRSDGHSRPHGEQESLIQSGATRLDGRRPVNTDGGCLANGEPIGASGLRQVHEVVLELRGEAGDRQIAGPHRVGFTQVYGAPGGSACTVLSR